MEDKRFQQPIEGGRIDCYYHVYNRGVDKRAIFKNTFDYMRFEETLAYYIDGPHSVSLQLHKDKGMLDLQGLTRRVSIISYCLMNNHYHLFLRELVPNGMSSYMSDVSNSYTRYFNGKNHRQGVLFQGKYKRKEVLTEPSILQVSRYIHLNPSNPYTHPFSSLNCWITEESNRIIDARDVDFWINFIGGVVEYRSFVDSKILGDSSAGIQDLIYEV